MNHSLFHSTLRAAAILLGSCSLLCAQEGDPFEKKKQPDYEATKKPEAKEGKDFQKSQRDAAEEWFRSAKEKYQALERDGRNEEAQRLRRAVEERAAAYHKDGERDAEKKPATIPEPKAEKKIAEGPERLQHLHAAIGHLRQAGLHEPAQHLEGVAKQMRDELHEKQDLVAEEGTRRPRVRNGAEATRRAENEELRAQLHKIAVQLEELRLQVSKLQAADPARSEKQ